MYGSSLSWDYIYNRIVLYKLMPTVVVLSVVSLANIVHIFIKILKMIILIVKVYKAVQIIKYYIYNIYIYIIYTHIYICTIWRSWIRATWYNYENNQQDALYRLIYYSKSALHVSDNVFGHHQEHLTVFTVSGSVHPSCCRLLLVVVGPTGPTTTNSTAITRAPTVNQRLLLQLLQLLMMGMRMPETCWAIFKRQVINLRNCCIWLVDSVESMMMHGLANPKMP